MPKGIGYGTGGMAAKKDIEMGTMKYRGGYRTSHTGGGKPHPKAIGGHNPRKGKPFHARMTSDPFPPNVKHF